MSFGIVELITLLLGLQGLSVQSNPNAPTADAALQYAMPNADVVVQFDAVPVVPGNYKVLANLANQPQIKASPELAKAVRKAVTEMEGARGLVKGMTGVDLSTDVSDATMFVQIVPKQDPSFVIAVRGKFTTTVIDKVAGMTGKQAVRAGAAAMVEVDGGNAVAVTKDKVLLAGSADLIKARVQDTWKAPARARGSNLAHVADVIGTKPVFAVVLTMSPTARREALRELGTKKNFLSDVVQRHKMAAFAIYADGVGWQWVDNNRRGLDAMAQMSEGAMDLMRAAQIAPRGFAKILLGGLESYRGTDKNVDALLARKADVMKIVEAYSGDGNFKVQIDKNPATLTLKARATGKSLSEVFPGSLILPGMAWALIVRGGPDEMKSSVSTPAPIAVPPPRPAPRPAPRKSP